MKELNILKPFLEKIIYQAEQEYPKECCGLILGPSNQSGQLTRLLSCRNVQDEYHAKDPQQFPRSSRNAYFIDPKELLRAQKDARASEEEIRVIYHSHIDAPAVFSEEDERMALLDGEPLYADANYVILSINAGKFSDIRVFRWDAKTRQFKTVAD